MLTSDVSIQKWVIWFKRLLWFWAGCAALIAVPHLIKSASWMIDAVTPPHWWMDIRNTHVPDFKVGEDPDVEFNRIVYRDLFGGRGVDVRDRANRNACQSVSAPRIGAAYRESDEQVQRFAFSDFTGGCKITRPGEYMLIGTIILRPMNANTKRVVEFKSNWFNVTDH